MSLRSPMETIGIEGPIGPAPASDSVLPPIPKIAVIRL